MLTFYALTRKRFITKWNWKWHDDLIFYSRYSSRNYFCHNMKPAATQILQVSHLRNW